MKILFICGSLEPGFDGVGDYCRLLGEGLSQWGCEVLLLALNDPFVMPTIINKGINTEENESILYKYKRISSKISRRKKFLLVKNYLAEFEPEWISLQYVPYSYHPKGMDVLLPHFFSKLKENYRWHLMIHEPWVSGDMRFNKKGVISFVQRHLLKKLVGKLQPVLVHTSNPYYQDILMSGGVRSELLHLPGNIPVKHGKTGLMKKEFSEIGISEDYRNKWIVFGTFGRIRSNVSYTEVFEKVSKSPEARGKKMALLSIGNSGPFAERIFAEIKSNYNDKILIHTFGHRDVTDISAFFQCLDFGISSVPFYLIGKSGAYSAMRNHGLKILVPKPMDIRKQLLTEAYDSGYFLKIKDEDFSFERVAQIFLSNLKSVIGKSIDQEKEYENTFH